MNLARKVGMRIIFSDEVMALSLKLKPKVKLEIEQTNAGLRVKIFQRIYYLPQDADKLRVALAGDKDLV